ncbi:MAG: 3-hydroxyacyl-CoA dehydrogenase family protein [Solirubrobacteraceae bacterium]|nr:3-hydroxyacyl-CoA dehydrogenase family protein [Solirubrobacteraceae bacterium]
MAADPGAAESPPADRDVFPSVLVIGAGTMGAQIAMVVALSGRTVCVTDIAADALDRARAELDSRMRARVDKGRLTQEQLDDAFARLTTTTDLAAAASDVDLVIEAVVERLEAKRALFAELDSLCPTATVFASNSSSFMPSQMADARPDRFINLHFFNPALVMRCVEVIRAPSTAQQTVDAAVAFVRDIGKEPVLLDKEIPGFIANRILNAVRDEAVSLMENGVASVSQIDLACRTALGYPMGPFELMDLTGIDIGYLIKKARFEATGDPADAPARSMSELVAAGHLGRKTGRGWYMYENGEKVGEA